MTLTCEDPLAQQEPQVQFHFMRNGQVLGQDWNESSQLQVATVRREDSGIYWCEAQTAAHKLTRSRRILIHVQSELPGWEERPPQGFVTAGSCLESPQPPGPSPSAISPCPGSSHSSTRGGGGSTQKSPTGCFAVPERVREKPASPAV